jgi:hypothetical protein
MNRVALRVWQLSAPKFKSLTAVSYASNSDKIKEKGKGDQENYFSKEDRIPLINRREEAQRVDVQDPVELE